MSETKNVIKVTDKSTKALNTAASNLAKLAASVTADMESVATSQSELAYQIEVDTQKLADIRKQTEVELRDAQADLALSIKENADNVLSGLMSDRGLATISKDDLNELHNKVVTLSTSNEAEVTKAVKAAVSQSKAASEVDMTNVQAQHSVAVAQKDANLVALQTQNDSLAGQVAQLRGEIAAERQARVDIAEAQRPQVHPVSAK